MVLARGRGGGAACGCESEGGFWDFSRAFEAEHSCSLLSHLSEHKVSFVSSEDNRADQL